MPLIDGFAAFTRRVFARSFLINARSRLRLIAFTVLATAALPLSAELTRLDHISVPTSLNGYQAGVVDPSGQYAYLAAGSSPGPGSCRVSKVDLAGGVAVDSIGVPSSSCWFVKEALIDPTGTTAYFFFQFYNQGAPSNPFFMRVYRLDLATFAWDGFLTIATSSGAGPALMDPSGLHAYFVRNRSLGARIYRVDLTTFSIVDSLELQLAESQVEAAWIHPNGTFGFFVTASDEAASDHQVVRVDLDSMTRVDSTPVPGGWPVESVAVDAAQSMAYLGTNSSPGLVHQINFSLFDFGWEGSIVLDSGEDDLIAAVVDPDRSLAYFTTNTSPGRVVTVDLSTFERVDAVTLDVDESWPRVALASPIEPFIYVATNNDTVQGERLVRLRHIEGQPFVTIWQADNPGPTGPAQIHVPTAGAGYDYHLHWESLEQPERSGWRFNLTGSTTVDVEVIGQHRVSIYGDFPRIYFNSAGDRLKILSVEHWGDQRWASMVNAFSGAANLEINATDAPDLSQATSLAHMFRGATSLNSDLGHWDVSSITRMDSMFQSASAFDRSLGSWDIGNVTNMSTMLTSSGLSTASYDDTLTGWSAQTVQTGVPLGATGLSYCAVAERQSLIVDNSWSITGDAQAPGCAGAVPDVPTLLSPLDSATDIATDPLLSWNASSGAQVYDLQVATDAGFSEMVFDLPGLAGTSHQISGLDYLTMYYWRVRTRNDAGASGFSQARKFTTEDDPVVAPPMPVLVAPQDQSTDVSTSPSLKWNTAPTATSYRVQVAKDPLFSELVVDESGLTNNILVLSDLDFETLYYWRVRSVNVGGSSSFTQSWRFETEAQPQLPPGTPQPLSPPDTATDVPIDPVLIWDELPAAKTYRLQVALNANFSNLVIDQAGLTDAFFDLDGLSHSTTYYWRVRASNDAGTSEFSNAWRFITREPPEAPIFANRFEADQ